MATGPRHRPTPAGPTDRRSPARRHAKGTSTPPAHPDYDFQRLCQAAKARGCMLNPGKLTLADTFRVGCIGAIGPQEMRQAVHAVGETLREIGIPTGPA